MSWAENIENKLGNRGLTTQKVSLPLDCSFLSPYLLPLGKRIELVKVSAISVNDIVETVNFSIENHIPIIPLGGGKNNIGGLTPTKNSIVIDLKGIRYIHKEGRSLRIGSGTPFYENRSFLFWPKVYPSTYSEGATIGGNLEGGSTGIGSFKYGRTWNQFTAIKVVTPTGKIETYSDDRIMSFAHALGTTGVVIEVKLEEREENDYPRIFTFKDAYEASDFASKINDAYHVSILPPSRIFETNTWTVLVVFEDEISEGIDGRRLWEKRRLFHGGIVEELNTFYQGFYVNKDMLGEALKIASENCEVEAELINDRTARVNVIGNRENISKVSTSFENIGVRVFNLHSIKINSRLE
ncbi:FAD-binding oxidoreductase, partial [Acidianus sp. RZ1]|uniref:FAD-binding oxidoreductase n=1 Tax=Acidianus sp. RZ1 TaxID=1540082 RepID=UPI0014911FF2